MNKAKWKEVGYLLVPLQLEFQLTVYEPPLPQPKI